MELAMQRRGEYIDMQYLTEARTTLLYNMPLAEVRNMTLQLCRGFVSLGNKMSNCEWIHTLKAAVLCAYCLKYLCVCMCILVRW